MQSTCIQPIPLPEPLCSTAFGEGRLLQRGGRDTLTHHQLRNKPCEYLYKRRTIETSVACLGQSSITLSKFKFSGHRALIPGPDSQSHAQ